MKQKLIITLIFFLPCLLIAQSGWRFDKLDGFSLRDTNYFLKENIDTFKIIDQQNEVVAVALFNKVNQLSLFFSNDTLWSFTYDSLGKTRKVISKKGQYLENIPSYSGDSIYFKYSKDSTLITYKTYYSGKALKLNNDSLNKKYHKAEYENEATGSVVRPLPKKLKTKYEANKVYVVKEKRVVTYKKRGKANKTTILYPMKRAYFIKPFYLVIDNTAVSETKMKNRLYHQKLSFDKKGRINGFFFTDDPTSKYMVIYR